MYEHRRPGETGEGGGSAITVSYKCQHLGEMGEGSGSTVGCKQRRGDAKEKRGLVECWDAWSWSVEGLLDRHSKWMGKSHLNKQS